MFRQKPTEVIQKAYDNLGNNTALQSIITGGITSEFSTATSKEVTALVSSNIPQS